MGLHTDFKSVSEKAQASETYVGTSPSTSKIERLKARFNEGIDPALHSLSKNDTQKLSTTRLDAIDKYEPVSEVTTAST